MGFIIREQATINDSFKEFIRGGNYEKLIEQLMISFWFLMNKIEKRISASV